LVSTLAAGGVVQPLVIVPGGDADPGGAGGKVEATLQAGGVHVGGRRADGGERQRAAVNLSP